MSERTEPSAAPGAAGLGRTVASVVHAASATAIAETVMNSYARIVAPFRSSGAPGAALRTS